jgi:hypothetical protein
MPALPELSPRAVAFGAMTFDGLKLSEGIFCEIYNNRFSRHDFMKDPPLTLWQIIEHCGLSTAIVVMSTTTNPQLPNKPKHLLPLMVQTLGDVLVCDTVAPHTQKEGLLRLPAVLQTGALRHVECYHRAFNKRYEAYGQLRDQLDGLAYNSAMAEYERTKNHPIEKFRKPKPEGEPPVVDHQRVTEVQRQRSFVADLGSELHSLSWAIKERKRPYSFISWDDLVRSLTKIVEVAEAPFNNQGNYHTAIRYKEDKQRGTARMFVLRTFWNRYAAWCPIDI